MRFVKEKIAGLEWLFLILMILDVESFDITNDTCVSKLTCHECIRDPSCAWCADPKLVDNSNRCFHPSDQKVDCKQEYIWDPQNVLEVIERQELTEEVQMTPQKINLQLREREPFGFTIKYAMANYVDMNFVEIKHNASADIKIDFYTRCSNSSGEQLKTNKCASIKKGDIIKFEVKLELLKCPAESSDYLQTIQIYPVGIPDLLLVNVKMLCDCACEHPDNKLFEKNSPSCSLGGTLKCGICDCHPNRFGRHCECDGSPRGTDSCLAPGSKLECSGRGICVCGQCACDMRENADEVISGNYCECDNFSCDRHNGLLCAGPDRGICDCGVCICKNGWKGADCSKSESH